MRLLAAVGLTLALVMGPLGALPHAEDVAVSTLLHTPPARPNGQVTRIVLDRVESPTFEGQSFGAVGPYEKLVGRAFGEVDPAHPLNASLVYLDRAPRNARGMVEYDVDVYVLKPIDMDRGNRTLLYDVVNRGNKPLFSLLNVSSAGGNDPSTAVDSGDGWAMRQGYTLVWSGWQGDAPPGNGRLTARFPLATRALC
jgi:hypothetical protein